jgi:PPOX class probable F420-dependent enzyme
MMLSDEIKTLIRVANFAHFATLMTDGSPQVAPVWVDLEGDSILVCTGEGSLKRKNTRRDPRVGLSIIGMDNPYKEAQIRGRIVERRPDPEFKTMDRIARKYTGRPFRSATIPPSGWSSSSRSTGHATPSCRSSTRRRS